MGYWNNVVVEILEADRKIEELDKNDVNYERDTQKILDECQKSLQFDDKTFAEVYDSSLMFK